ncbi:MAG TPA: RluA family pseudouridine synthase [Blastocatellia bacterium]|nr:RluA family pseudouridine synthase [Blastocatellia bacterium]
MSTEPHSQFLNVSADAVGLRLDSFLASCLKDISRTRIQHAIQDGDILINQLVSKPGYRLRDGDQIEVDLPAPPPVELIPEAIPLNILFEDDDVVVVDKPAGMVVHPGAGIESGTLANALVHHFNALSSVAGSIRPGIVHRLDKDTSGLLVVAKNDLAHQRLSDQFRERQVYKLYVALVYGRLSNERGEIEARIGRGTHNRTRMAVLKGGAGRPAHTIFEVAHRYQDFTLLNVQIKTGRTHQIRVHLAHIGHPVAGDASYGSGRINSLGNLAIKRAVQALGRHFLHSTELAFNHPRNGDRLEFTSPLPVELEALLAKLN